MAKRREIIPPTPPGRAQPEKNPKKEQSGLEEQLAQIRLELEKANARLKSTETARRSMAEELERLKTQFPAIKDITTEPDALLQGLKRVLETLVKREKELQTTTGREQNNQIRSLAEIAELQETAKAKELQIEALQKEKRQEEDLWQKERDQLRRSIDQLKVENKRLTTALRDAQQFDKEFTDSIGDLREAVPALKEVEPKPESMLKVLLAELLSAREIIKQAGDLEKKLQEFASLEQLDTRLGNLIEENRRLQEQFDSLDENSKIFETQAREAAKLADQKISTAVATATEQAQRNIEAMSQKVSALEAENNALKTQLQDSGKIPLISPDRLSALLDEFYETLGGNLKGFSVNDSEIRLKVGFGSLSDNRVGFVIPTAGNTAEMQEGLSEIILHLGKNELLG